MEEPSSLTRQAKFIRRTDLDATTRAKIGTIAYLFPRHGTISRLSRRHGLSRKFVYELRDGVKAALGGLFGADKAVALSASEKWLQSVRLMLQLRLKGGCDVRSTAGLMRDQGAEYCSAGFVSQTLRQIGGLLPATIPWKGTAFMASDEIFFLGRKPILVSTSVHSLAVLGANICPALTKEAWQSHWSGLSDAGICADGLTADEGWVLRAARLEDLTGVPWQPDTFHAVTHRLGPIIGRLERQAHKAIEKEYGRQALLKSAAKPSLEARFRQQWEEGRQKSRQEIEVLENFRFLYQCIVRQFNPFDRHGQLRPAQKAGEEVETALGLLETLPVKGLVDEVAAIRKTLPDLFNFLRRAQRPVSQLEQQVGELALPFWCTAWQYLKKANKSFRRPRFQAYALQQTQGFLAMLQDHLGLGDEPFAQLQQDVFGQLDQIVQSSASVETFNSFLRPFLNNSRDQLSQEMLNLIVFYYNRRVFERGKRKGKSPLEILSGQKPDNDWLGELLLIAQKGGLN